MFDIHSFISGLALGILMGEIFITLQSYLKYRASKKRLDLLVDEWEKTK